MRFSPSLMAALASACALPAVAQTTPDPAIGSPLSLTFYVAPVHPVEAEAMARSIQTPGSANYHKFLTVPQFVSNYAVSNAELQNIEDALINLGFTIGYVYPNHLAIEVLGSVGTTQNALDVHMKSFTVNGRTGLAASKPPTLPGSLQGRIRAVGGLNTVTHAQPMHRVMSGSQHTTVPVSGALVGGRPGNYLPIDFAKFYDLAPIYEAGITGRGATVGIVTLNDFNTADAYSFWQNIGLSVSQTRITKVNVDGGESAASNNTDGEAETDIDVEYSGSLAPSANLRVYIAPNQTDANFIDGFEAAASENIVDTVSTSWGEPELDFFFDPATQSPADTSLLTAFHDAFLEMALQGQTVYVASGDSGAFDTVRGCPAFGTPTAKTPVCNSPFAVDSPSNDPLVTAAGGTTRPFKVTLRDGITLSVPTESAWSWSYIVNEAADQGGANLLPLSEFFSVGDGGGVSSFWARPWYQNGVKGTTATKPGQFFSADFGSGSTVQAILPANFAGRNMPDISADADPETGYQFIEGGVAYDFEGGTSFVAPELNGTTALFVQFLGKRVGQINPALYQLGNNVTTDITTGDNWGYSAFPGYDNAVGLGTLDGTRLLIGLDYLTTLK